MSYAALSDVQGMIGPTGVILSATSNVTADTVVNEILPMYDRYIDDRLARYYPTPITGPNALLTVNRIEKLLASAEVVERLYVNQAPSDGPQAVVWRAQAEAMLTHIVQGDVILSDAGSTAETPEPTPSVISDGISGNPYNQPKFRWERMQF